jgi:hypothetical protein
MAKSRRIMGLLEEDFEAGAVSSGFSFLKKKENNIVCLPFHIKCTGIG